MASATIARPKVALDPALLDLPHVNLCRERHDDACLELIEAEEAWANLVLPVNEDERGTLVFATTVETFAAARELVRSRVTQPFRFVLAEVRSIEQFIAQRYGYEGIACDDRIELEPQ